jgi:hypothetical protein
VFVLLMTAGAVVPILLIRVVSHTAMLPNALAPLAWLFAMGLTRVLSMSGAVMWKAGVLAGIGLCVWVMGGNRLAPVDECFEVGAYLPEYDLNSLPEGAMVLSDATRMAPLLLKRMVLGRDDVVIVLESQWRRREGGAEGGRAVFAATAPEDEDVENREGAMVGGFYRLGGGLSGE